MPDLQMMVCRVSKPASHRSWPLRVLAVRIQTRRGIKSTPPIRRTLRMRITGAMKEKRARKVSDRPLGSTLTLNVDPTRPGERKRHRERRPEQTYAHEGQEAEITRPTQDSSHDREERGRQSERSRPQKTGTRGRTVDTRSAGDVKSFNSVSTATPIQPPDLSILRFPIRAITKAPIHLFFTLGSTAALIEGARQIAEMASIAAATTAKVARRDSTPADLSATKSVLSHLLNSNGSASNNQIFISCWYPGLSIRS